MNVFLNGAIVLGVLFFMECMSQYTTEDVLKKCSKALLNLSNIELSTSFKGPIALASKEHKDEQLLDDTSMILVSKFHRKPYNIGLIPKFSNHIQKLAGILLHSAVLENRLDVFNLLFYVGADIEVPNRQGRTPLYKAIKNRQYQMVSTLIKCGADPNFSFRNISLLHNAILEGELHVLETLVELGAVVDIEDRHEKTPLYYALISGKREIVNKLIEAGGNINFKSISGKTLLHHAVSENRSNILNDLITLGAMIDVADNAGITPLYVSLMFNYSGITEILVNAGANINFVSSNGDSLLHKAVSAKKDNVVDLLLKLGSNQMMLDQEGLTPLYRAIKEDSLHIIKSLALNPDVLNKRPPSRDDYPIHFAVSNGSYSSVKFLLEKGSDKYTRNKQDLFPLGLAISQNKTDIVELLLSKEPKVQKSEPLLKSLSRPLHMAVSNGNILAVKCLLEFGVSENTTSEEGKSLLAVAAENNDVPMIYLLIANGANVSTKNDQGDSLLHMAVSKGAYDAVKVLVELGLDVEAANNHGLTPLILAVSVNSPAIIKYLVSKGANVNRKLKSGDKPLLMAVRNGNFTTVTTLIELGAEIDNSKNSSPIEEAVKADRTDIIKLLVAKGVPLRDRRISLIHLAAESGSVNAIETLLSMGIPVDSQYSGFTPLWAATKKGRSETMEVLLRSGANINEMANPPFSIRGSVNSSWSLLHEAVYRNFANATSVLLRHGIDPNTKDFRSWTPLHYAAIINNFEIAEILIKNGADAFAKTNNGLSPLGIVSYSEEESKQKLIDLLKKQGERQVN